MFSVLIYLYYRADGFIVVTVVVVPAHIFRFDVHAPRIVRVVRAERTRPIFAVVARVERLPPIDAFAVQDLDVIARRR